MCRRNAGPMEGPIGEQRCKTPQPAAKRLPCARPAFRCGACGRDILEAEAVYMRRDRPYCGKPCRSRCPERERSPFARGAYEGTEPLRPAPLVRRPVRVTSSANFRNLSVSAVPAPPPAPPQVTGSAAHGGTSKNLKGKSVQQQVTEALARALKQITEGACFVARSQGLLIDHVTAMQIKSMLVGPVAALRCNMRRRSVVGQASKQPRIGVPMKEVAGDGRALPCEDIFSRGVSDASTVCPFERQISDASSASEADCSQSSEAWQAVASNH